jgi:hypothetical protein
LAGVRTRMVDHRPLVRVAAGRFVRRDAIEQIVKQPPLQGHQVRVRHFEQAPATAALGEQVVAVVLITEMRATLPSGGSGQPPHAGVGYIQPLTEGGRVRPVRDLAIVEAQRQRVHADALAQDVAAQLRLVFGQPGMLVTDIALDQAGQHAWSQSSPVLATQPGTSLCQWPVPEGVDIEAGAHSRRQSVNARTPGQHGAGEGQRSESGEGVHRL